jgi:hypothetical protein
VDCSGKTIQDDVLPTSDNPDGGFIVDGSGMPFGIVQVIYIDFEKWPRPA